MVTQGWQKVLLFLYDLEDTISYLSFQIQKRVLTRASAAVKEGLICNLLLEDPQSKGWETVLYRLTFPFDTQQLLVNLQKHVFLHTWIVP